MCVNDGRALFKPPFNPFLLSSFFLALISKHQAADLLGESHPCFPKHVRLLLSAGMQRDSVSRIYDSNQVVHCNTNSNKSYVVVTSEMSTSRRWPSVSYISTVARRLGILYKGTVLNPQSYDELVEAGDDESLEDINRHIRGNILKLEVMQVLE